VNYLSLIFISVEPTWWADAWPPVEPLLSRVFGTKSVSVRSQQVHRNGGGSVRLGRLQWGNPKWAVPRDAEIDFYDLDVWTPSLAELKRSGEEPLAYFQLVDSFCGLDLPDAAWRQVATLALREDYWEECGLNSEFAEALASSLGAVASGWKRRPWNEGGDSLQSTIQNHVVIELEQEEQPTALMSRGGWTELARVPS